MDTLSCNVDKKQLLDILALLLWGADLKSQIASRHSTLDDYKTLNMRCRDLSDLYFLEKRLELIEESLAEKR